MQSDAAVLLGGGGGGGVLRNNRSSLRRQCVGHLRQSCLLQSRMSYNTLL